LSDITDVDSHTGKIRRTIVDQAVILDMALPVLRRNVSVESLTFVSILPERCFIVRAPSSNQKLHCIDITGGGSCSHRDDFEHLLAQALPKRQGSFSPISRKGSTPINIAAVPFSKEGEIPIIICSQDESSLVEI